MVTISFEGSKRSRIATTRQGAGGSCPDSVPADCLWGTGGVRRHGVLSMGPGGVDSSSLPMVQSGCVFVHKRYLAQAIEENGVELCLETQRGMIPGKF